MVYILAFHATAVSGLCVLAGVLVHYFLLATFFSMAADAILIFNKTIFVFVKIPRYVPVATIISWCKFPLALLLLNLLYCIGLHLQIDNI